MPVTGADEAADASGHDLGDVDLRVLHRALDALGPAVVATDADGAVSYWNAAAEQLLGSPAAQVLGRPIAEAAQRVDPLARAGLQEALTARAAFTGELVLEDPEGTPVPVLVTTQPIPDEDHVTGTVSVLLDIRDRVAAEHRAELRAAQMSAIAAVGELAFAQPSLDDLLDGALRRAVEALDADIGSAFVREGDGLRMLAGVGLPEAMVGVHRIELGAASLGGYTLDQDDPVVVDHLPSETRFAPPPALLAAGAVTGVTAVMRAEGRGQGVLGIYRRTGRRFEPDDISALQGIANVLGQAIERERAQERLQRFAITDHLTGLPNRLLFVDRLEQALAHPDAGTVTVLYIDLDGFKDTNDALGHAAGDELLKAVAERIVASVRDTGTVARFGGDELAVLTEAIDNPAEAMTLARRVAAAVGRDPILIDGREVHSTVSVGIVVADPSADAAGVLRDADAAMHRAKQRGRGSVELFDPELREAALERLRITEELGVALASGQLVAHYQPEVALDGSEVWAEALVRWEHPERGLLSPAEFVDVAEATGLIVPIGEQVLTLAATQLARWLRLGPGEAPTSVSVNISAHQLVDRNLVELAGDLIRSLDLPPRSLWMELTETAILEDFDQAIARLAELRELGVGIAIDDFGTGYSSLTYARLLPVDAFKVDRSFVAGMVDDARDEGIVRATVSLARSFGLLSVAEGVEDQAQLDLLREIGCHFAQGFHICRPGPAEVIERWVRQRAAGAADAR